MRFTTLSCLCLACAASGVSGQSILNTNRIARPLTENECIRLALEHNLRIQIRRIDPNIERYTLAASYGVYDPVFSAGYNKSSRTTEGRFDATSGVNSSASTSDADALGAGFSGYLPSGLTYNMTGDIAHNRGEQSGNPFDNYVSGVGIALEQPLLRNFWIDQNRLNIKIAKQNIKVSQYNLDTEIRTVVLEVQKAYYEVARALEEIKVQERRWNWPMRCWRRTRKKSAWAPWLRSRRNWLKQPLQPPWPVSLARNATWSLGKTNSNLSSRTITKPGSTTPSTRWTSSWRYRRETACSRA